MSTYRNDTFTGTSGTNLEAHTADSGETWAAVSGTGTQKLDGTGGVYRASAPQYYTLGGTIATADYQLDLYINALTIVASDLIQGLARFVDSSNMYRILASPTTITMDKLVAGASTVFGTYSYTLPTGATKLSIRVQGDQISGLVDDTVVLGPFTDTAFSSAGKIGLRVGAGSSPTQTTTTGLHADRIVAQDDSLTPITPTAKLWVYGHSFTQDPGVSCTTGQEFYKQVQSRLSSRFTAVTTYGVGSSRAVDVSQDVIGQAVRTPKGGSTWDPTRLGAIILDCLFNDAYNTTSAAPSTAGALSSTQQSNLTASLATILAVLGAGSRVECETGTKGGTWLSDSSSSRYSGGAVTRCASNGGTLTVNVTVPSAGYVWLLHYGVSSSQAGQFTVTEGATTYATVTAATQNVASVYSKRATAADETVMPFVTKITASPGAHTFVITKTNNDSLTIYPDCFLLPADTPLPLIVLRDPMTTSNDGTGSWNASGNTTNFSTVSANLALVNTCLDNAIALVGHPNLTLLDPALTDAQRTPDGLHPNDAGMTRMADVIVAAMGGTLLPALHLGSNAGGISFVGGLNLSHRH